MKQLIPKDKQKLVYIKWQDAHSQGAWLTAEQLEAEIGHESWIAEEVGWIVYEDEKEIHLVCRRGLWSKADTSEYGMYQRIPKAWILKRKLVVPRNEQYKKGK